MLLPMPRSYILNLLLAFTVLSLSACVWKEGYDQTYIIPFSQTLRQQHELSNADIKQLYFYISRPITLRYQESSGDRRVQDGRLLREVDKYIDEVIIEPGTRGIAVASGEHWVDVSFEKSGAFLRFGLSADKNWQNRYPLWASRWRDGRGELDGELLYDGRPYFAIRDSQHSYLTVDSRYLKNVEQHRRWAEGRRLEVGADADALAPDASPSNTDAVPIEVK